MWTFRAHSPLTLRPATGQATGQVMGFAASKAAQNATARSVCEAGFARNGVSVTHLRTGTAIEGAIKAAIKAAIETTPQPGLRGAVAQRASTEEKG